MELLKNLLEADIELQKDSFKREKDDPNVSLNFEHALVKDLSQMKLILSKMHNKLNNKELLNKVQEMYAKVDDLPPNEQDNIVLYNHIPGRNFKNPILTLAHDLETILKDLENIMEDTTELEKI